MQKKKFWTLVALAGLTAVTLVRPERDVEARSALAPLRRPLTRDGIASGDSSVASPSSVAAAPNADSPWLLLELIGPQFFGACIRR
jgi:hypothetical protein